MHGYQNLCIFTCKGMQQNKPMNVGRYLYRFLILSSTISSYDVPLFDFDHPLFLCMNVKLIKDNLVVISWALNRDNFRPISVRMPLEQLSFHSGQLLLSCYLNLHVKVSSCLSEQTSPLEIVTLEWAYLSLEISVDSYIFVISTWRVVHLVRNWHIHKRIKSGRELSATF